MNPSLPVHPEVAASRPGSSKAVMLAPSRVM
jgi:hypothetical protein